MHCIHSVQLNCFLILLLLQSLGFLYNIYSEKNINFKSINIQEVQVKNISMVTKIMYCHKYIECLSVKKYLGILTLGPSKFFLCNRGVFFIVQSFLKRNNKFSLYFLLFLQYHNIYLFHAYFWIFNYFKINMLL